MEYTEKELDIAYEKIFSDNDKQPAPAPSILEWFKLGLAVGGSPNRVWREMFTELVGTKCALAFRLGCQFRDNRRCP